jgi:hypothetical protein
MVSLEGREGGGERLERTHDEEVGSRSDGLCAGKELGRGVDGAETLGRGEGVRSAGDFGQPEAGTSTSFEPGALGEKKMKEIAE